MIGCAPAQSARQAPITGYVAFSAMPHVLDVMSHQTRDIADVAAGFEVLGPDVLATGKHGHAARRVVVDAGNAEPHSRLILMTASLSVECRSGYDLGSEQSPNWNF